MWHFHCTSLSCRVKVQQAICRVSVMSKNDVSYFDVILVHWNEITLSRWLSRLQSEGMFQVPLLQLNLLGTLSKHIISDASEPVCNAGWEGFDILWKSNRLFFARVKWLEAISCVGIGTSQTDQQDWTDCHILSGDSCAK